MGGIASDTVDRAMTSRQPNLFVEENKAETVSLPPNDAVNVQKERSDNKPKRSSRSSRLVTALAMLLQMTLMDLPVLIAFGAYVATFCLEHLVIEYHNPLMELQRFDDKRRRTELTYFHRACGPEDMTATDTVDLVADGTPTAAKDLMLKHGVTVFPNLLKPATATAVRDFILEQNLKNEDMIGVIENAHRWSFRMRVDQHPSIPQALNEVLSNQHLVDSLEAIMGKDAAIVEFTTITSAYGATSQYYHSDVITEGNGAKFARNFMPTYSLFIPLQNITGAMGATHLCPGSHMCAQGGHEYCPVQGFQASGAADNWPMGWGALVNQQTMHKGEGHTDRDGPHRVLFILSFAPRPQYGWKQVETRGYGIGSSYSLHWTQWGHTLSDWREPWKYMTQPWRVLKSLGLYKPPGRNWGRDYVAIASALVTSGDNEIRQNIHVKYLPEHLQADYELDGDDDPQGASWPAYYLTVIGNCRIALKSMHLVLLVSYGITLLTVSLLWSRYRLRTIVSGIGRLLVDHAVVLAVAWLILYRVSVSDWARNIKFGRQHRWPKAPQILAPSLPGTLPLLDDIMMFDDMQSEYFASYTEVLDVAHPGNAAWRETLPLYAPGFNNLSSALQRQICKDVLSHARRELRRFLVKNVDNQWAEADERTALRFCHKELMKLSDPLMYKTLRQLDFLLTETKFGYWRDTAMHRRWIPLTLRALQDQIMGFAPSAERPWHPQARLGASVRAVSLVSRQQRPWSPLQKPPIPLRTPHSMQRAPYDSDEFWIQVGDTVEASYGSLLVEWYRGTIIGVDAHDMGWHVRYDDGDEDEFLCQTCVRHFVDYDVKRPGESIGWRGDDMQYYDVEVIGKHKDGTYDVEIDTIGVRRNVPPSRLRREVEADENLIPGARVSVRYPGTTDWYLGEISGRNGDGTFAIKFADGDYVQQIPPRDVVLAASLEEGEYESFFDADDADEYDEAEEEYDSLVPGAPVNARFPDTDDWYGGRIASVNSDGTFAIQFDDGDFSQSIPEEDVELASPEDEYE